MASRTRSLLAAVSPEDIDWRLLESLLLQGASPDEFNDEGYTCLHLLAGCDHHGVDQCLDRLLDYGAQCNVRTLDDGLTPLHIAASWGKEDFIKKLIAAGADVTAANHDGETAEDMAGNAATAALLQQCSDTIGLSVIHQPLQNNNDDDDADDDGMPASVQDKHRVFESVILHDMSDMDDITDHDSYDCDHLAVPGMDSISIADVSPADGHSPGDAAHIYASDDSLLGATESDATPNAETTPRNDDRQAVMPTAARRRSEGRFGSPCLPGNHDNMHRTNHKPSSKVPVGILRNSQSSHSTSASDSDSQPLGPTPQPSLYNRKVRDTTFRLSIGSPVIPSQTVLDPDEDRSVIQSDVASIADPNQNHDQDDDGLHIIEARRPWHSAGDELDSDSDDDGYSDGGIARTGQTSVATAGHAPQQIDPDCTVSYDMEDEEVTSPPAKADVTLVVPSDIEAMSNSAVRVRLRALGENVGPVMDGTRRVYVRLLARLEAQGADDGGPTASQRQGNGQTQATPAYSRELHRCLTGATSIPNLLKDEVDLCPLQRPATPKRRNGGAGTPVNGGTAPSAPALAPQDYVTKAFFIYFLLDPAKSCNLPLRAVNDSLSELECFQQFVDSIFYIGKGKRSRPFAHLHDAAKYCNSQRYMDQDARQQPKLERIRQIWKSGRGVVQFSCFQGSTSAEAHNREACCLDTVGISNLTNKVSGTYYGTFAGNSGAVRRTMGVYLLMKACRIFLQQGERQYCSTVPVS